MSRTNMLTCCHAEMLPSVMLLRGHAGSLQGGFRSRFAGSCWWRRCRVCTYVWAHIVCCADVLLCYWYGALKRLTLLKTALSGKDMTLGAMPTATRLILMPSCWGFFLGLLTHYTTNHCLNHMIKPKHVAPVARHKPCAWSGAGGCLQQVLRYFQPERPVDEPTLDPPTAERA